MFDGENCIRCNKYYKFEELEVGPDGFGICHNCAIRINPIGEKKHQCLNDGTEMKKELIYNRILLDKCPTCGGIWLDGDEIEIIRRVMKSEGAGRFASGFLLGVIVG
jgi:TFIIB-like protein